MIILDSEGGFSHLKEAEINYIQEEVDEKWGELLTECAQN